MSLAIISRLKFLNLRKINNNIYKKCILLNYKSCSTDVPKRKKLEEYFFDNEVQSILKKITGLNYDKVFRARQVSYIHADKFEFVTDKQLNEMMEKAKDEAAVKLQMPPVMDIREPIDEVLSKDPNLQYYLKTKLIFIDTSPSQTARSRIITVRETDGTLRKANWDERIKMNQIFFPIKGRSLEKPKLFESPQLDKLLEDEEYEFILDAACLQFEPDDPEYHRVTSATYEQIKSKKQFDILRSTRHFGPMAFYFAANKDINPLLVDMLERQLISDAADTIKLLYILNPDLQDSEKEKDDIEYIKAYMERNKSPKTAGLELAFQTYLEVHSSSKEENVSL